MSSCAGDMCTHPDCTHGQQVVVARTSAEAKDELRRLTVGISSEKWSRMNRAERRAAARGRR